MKRIQILPLAAFAIIATMSSCSDDDSNSTDNGNGAGQVTAAANIEEAGDYTFSTAKQIALTGTSATSDDETVTTEANKVTITQAGTYHVSGTLTDGQLVVDADKDDKVQIIFDGVSITSNSGAAVDIQNADKVIIDVQAGTTNTINDADGNNQDAAIFSRTKLSIFGTGTLNVNGNDSAAIHSEGGVILKESTFTFNADADAVNTDHNITIYSGNLSVNAGGDGFNAEEDIIVKDGEINITQSEDGFEAGAVYVAGGTLNITANEDGISVDGQNTDASTELYIQNGYVYVNASGNGFDADGSIKIDAGTVIIEGPTSNDNVAINYTSSFKINGGYLIAVNGDGNIDTPDTTSSQNSVLINFSSTQDADTLVHLQTTLGANIATFKPSKSFKTILISSATVNSNGTFQLYTGGTATGDVLNGLYNLVNYVGGSLQATFTVTSSVTTVDASQA